MRRGGFADGGAQRGLDHDVLVVGADLLEDFRGAVGIEVVDERSVEAHHQAFARRDAGRFLERLRLDRHFVVGLQRIDEWMPSPSVSPVNLAEEREHADVAGADAGHRTEEQDHEEEGRDSQADQAKQVAAAGRPAVNDSAASWIENRHCIFSRRDSR